MKPGFKTTEFAFTAVFMVLQLLAVLAGYVKDPMLGGIASAVVVAAYAVARGLAKQNEVKVPDELARPPRQ